MTHDHDRAKINRVNARVSVLKSQVDRLEGKVESLLEDARSKAISIQKLQDEQGKLDGMSFVGKKG